MESPPPVSLLLARLFLTASASYMVDLSAEMAAFAVGKQQALVNLQTLKTAGEISKNLIDVMA